MTDSADRLRAALVAQYRIERELGAGGMATVFQAHDLKHDRDVAIKLLHPDLAAALGGERFLTEIKTTARLQHPHILPLLDSGAADGLLYYVMPYVSGETLRARLEREKQLPIADALRIATEVADALGAAHALGIIHRDIKPENILLQGGHALVADFGIALAVHNAGSARMTQTGMSLGTPQYMSPEQAMGEKTVDARADVYALGAVTYEMLTGEPPFTGSTVQAIVAKLMTDPARPLTELRKSVPRHVEAAVLAALEKLPADRIGSAMAFAQALADPTRTVASASSSARYQTKRVSTRLGRGFGVALNVVLAGAALFLWMTRSAPPSTSRQHVLLWRRQLPSLIRPGANSWGNQAAIAPDGSSIVYSDSAEGGYRLMRKRRDAAEAAPLAGTEGGISPFFSPDGKWVGYTTLDKKLRKVPVAGGGSVTLAEDVSPSTKTGAWLDDGTIVYPAEGKTVKRIPADGGPAVTIPFPAQLDEPHLVWPLPRSRGFLFTACPANCFVASSVYAYDLMADSAHMLVAGAAGAWYSAVQKHLLYTSREGGLFASGFDLQRMALTSGAIPLIEDVEPTGFSWSASGTVLYTTSSASQARAELVWVTRDGREAPLDSTWHGGFEYPALSPDGKAVAVGVRDKKTDLWIRHADGTRAKVDAPGVANWRPFWLPDGRSLTFISLGKPDDPNDVVVYQVGADGSAKPGLLQKDKWGIYEAEVSRDGQWLVLRLDEEDGNGSVRFRRLSGDTTLKPVLVGSGGGTSIALSPDGRWLAYSSVERGVESYELNVASFPDLKSKRLVSSGGTEARWSRDGRELYWVSAGQLMASAVAPGPSFNPGPPRALFSVEGYRRARNRPQYDVGPDGRFVMIKEPGGAVGAIYVENWLAELRTKIQR